jgi:hypothetical protein
VLKKTYTHVKRDVKRAHKKKYSHVKGDCKEKYTRVERDLYPCHASPFWKRDVNACQKRPQKSFGKETLKVKGFTRILTTQETAKETCTHTIRVLFGKREVYACQKRPQRSVGIEILKVKGYTHIITAKKTSKETCTHTIRFLFRKRDEYACQKRPIHTSKEPSFGEEHREIRALLTV